MFTWRLSGLVIAALVACASAAVCAEPLPPVCAELPSGFSAARTAYIDDEHKALAARARSVGSEQDRAAVAAQLKRRIAKEEPASASRAAILAVDLLGMYDNKLPPAEVKRLTGNIRRELSIAPGTPAGVDAYAMFELAGSYDDNRDNLTPLRAALALHRATFGETPRQVQIWDRLYDGSKAPQDKLQVARKFHEAAIRMNAPNALFGAQLRLFRDLPKDDSLRRVLAEPISTTALAVAATPVPVKGTLGGSCYGTFKSFTTEMTTALALARPAEDRKAFVKSAVKHLAASLSFGTHSGFVLEDISLILSARNLDYPSFLAAMARLETEDRTCKPPKFPEAICGLLGSANILFDNSQPTIGLALLRDAEKLIATTKMPVELTWRIRVALAEAEWQHGSKPVAAAAVAAMKIADVERFAKTSTLATVHRLKAEIADANLDPAQAKASFEALIALALKGQRDAANRGDGEGDEEGGGLQMSNSTAGNVDVMADALVARHLRGQFCLDCGKPVADAAMKWIAYGVDDAALKPAPAAIAYLASLSVHKQGGKLAMTRFERSLLKAFEKDWKPFAENALRRLPSGAAPTDVMRLVALATRLADANGLVLNKDNADALMHVIVETDLDRQVSIWSATIAKQLNSEPDGTQTGENALDGVAHDLATHGYPRAANFVLQMMLNLIDFDTAADGDANGEPSDAAKTAPDTAKKDAATDVAEVVARYKGKAAFWASAYARLASLDVAVKDWTEANDGLERAQAIAAARLDEEWTTSADRIAPLIRELRQVLQQIAESRVAISAQAPAADHRATETFDALQLAMLGETAAGMQAALRRRLTGDSALAQAIASRDDMTFRQRLLTAFDASVGVIDQAARDAEGKAIADQMAALQTQIDALLPVSESVTSIKPLPLDRTQALLADDEALLILHAGQEGIFASLTRKVGAPRFWSTPMPLGALEAGIKAMRRGLDNDDGTPFPLLQAHNLYTTLLGPIAADLDQTKRLIVMADGPLLALPLAALPRTLPKVLPTTEAQYRGVGIVWLGVSHAISYLPTVRVLEARAANRLASKAPLPFAGIGNPDYGGRASAARVAVVAPTAGVIRTATRGIDTASVYRRGPLADRAVLARLDQLPETADELRAIGKMLGSRDEDLYLGPRANVGTIRDKGLADYRIIMFATHGIMGGEVAGVAEPGLVLTVPKVTTADDDGVLSASKIASLKLDADLVILSACNTASSDGRPRAEGFSGLTRAFLAAGARSVIVTHWSIPSTAAVQVTTRMVDERQRNPDLSWSEALRRSFANMVESEGPAQFAHPAYWGAFTVVGDGGAR